jgi:surface antigen
MGVGGVRSYGGVARRVAALALAALVCACATTSETAGSGPSPAVTHASQQRAHLVATDKRLQCVPFARRESGVEIYGNANEWWGKAAGKYRRSRAPSPGAVMVFNGSSGDPRGHVAVVREIRNGRLLIIDHANWLGRGEVTVATPVIDVSPKNDWSQVRVWFIPGDQWGARVFQIAGFIYPERIIASN